FLSPRPHTPTPFPYTTLFRSHEQRTHRVDEVSLVGIVLASVHSVKGGGVDHDGGAIARDPGRDRIGSRHIDVLVRGADVIHPRGDRKSTRLNSSHQIISYAVF